MTEPFVLDRFSFSAMFTPEMAAILGWSEEEIVRVYGRLHSERPPSEEEINYVVEALRSNRLFPAEGKYPL